jgi:hypothetical protein
VAAIGRNSSPIPAASANRHRSCLRALSSRLPTGHVRFAWSGRDLRTRPAKVEPARLQNGSRHRRHPIIGADRSDRRTVGTTRLTPCRGGAKRLVRPARQICALLMGKTGSDRRTVKMTRDPTRTSIGEMGEHWTKLPMISTLDDICWKWSKRASSTSIVASLYRPRWYPSTWFNNGTEMPHDSRLLSAYLSVASAAKEARYNAPQRSDGGALIACFQASVAALRSRTSSGHGVCAST